MKNTSVLMSGVIICLLLFCQTAMALRVACVGDSHTYSGGLSNPDVSYPAQLETILKEFATHKDGILNGDPIWMPTGGMSGGALQFDGIDDYIAGPFVLNPTAGPFSFCAWIKTASPGSVIVSQANAFYDWLSIDSSGKLMTPLSYPMPALMSDAVITDETWHHIVLVSDGVGKYLYVDGVEVASDTSQPVLPVNGNLTLGAGRVLEPDSFFTGLMDDVRIYNQALEPSEIAELVQ